MLLKERNFDLLTLPGSDFSNNLVFAYRRLIFVKQKSVAGISCPANAGTEKPQIKLPVESISLLRTGLDYLGQCACSFSGVRENITILNCIKPVAMKLRKLETADLPLMEKWVHNGHVAAFLGDPQEWLEEVKANMGADWIGYFIAETDRPVGFIQYYDPTMAPVGIWSQAPRFSMGIDFFVGDAEILGKGIASQMVGLMKKKMRWEKLCKFMVADPDPDDPASVRVLEKNGFIKQPNGLFQVEVDS